MRIPKIEADTTGVWQKIQAMARCSHPTTTPRKKTSSVGVVSVWQQCDRCGDKVASIPKKTLSAEAIACLEDWDDGICKAFHEQRQELHQRMYDEERERARAEWWRQYEAVKKVRPSEKKA